MARYVKKAVIVDAKQVGSQTNLGSLGTSLATSDWIIELASGTLVTLSNATFVSKYDSTSEGTTLTGTDYD